MHQICLVYLIGVRCFRYEHNLFSYFFFFFWNGNNLMNFYALNYSFEAINCIGLAHQGDAHIVNGIPWLYYYVIVRAMHKYIEQMKLFWKILLLINFPLVYIEIRCRIMSCERASAWSKLFLYDSFAFFIYVVSLSFVTFMAAFIFKVKTFVLLREFHEKLYWLAIIVCMWCNKRLNGSSV